MSDTMLFGVLKMPFEMAMRDEISRIQFYQRVQELVARVEAQPEQEPVAISTDCVFPEWKPGNSDFKHWCYQHFGADSDEKYLAEAVLMLPRKQILPMKAADEFELHRLLAEKRYTVRQLSRALREQVESPTFMGEPLITHTTPPAAQPAPAGYTKKIEDLILERDDARDSRDFYKRRADALQQWQHKMRDPERTIVCDILANGHTLEPAGDRYTPPAAQRPWQGLDEDEIRELYGKDLNYRDGNYVRYAKSVEAKLKERNT